MSTVLPAFVEWLHILGGVVWFGGVAFMTFVMWPVLLRQPAPQARALFASLVGPISALMGASAQTVFWLGLVRGIAFGPVRSVSFLVGTAYGWTFMAALVLTLGVMAHGIASGRTFEARLWDGDAWRPGAARAVRRGNVVTFAALLLVLACMVLMGFGL